MGCEAERAWATARLPSSFLFPFSVFLFLLLLFEFKFGLNYEFKIDVTYLLEFREFCLAILYNKNRCGFVIQK